jgi:hypothetical protein
MPRTEIVEVDETEVLSGDGGADGLEPLEVDIESVGGFAAVDDDIESDIVVVCRL